MNTMQVISRESFISGNLFAGSTARKNYLWKNLIIEKRISVNWLYKMYKNSFFHDFWSVLSSPINT